MATTEYDEFRSAGLSDHQIGMLRNTGASHAAILLYARKQAAEIHFAADALELVRPVIERQLAEF